MAAPQHVRAAPLALALRTRAAAAAPVRSPETSRRALLGLSEPELRQLAVDLGQVPSPSKLAKAPPPHGFLAYRFLDSLSCAYCLTHAFAQQSYRGKQLHDLLYKSRAKQIQEFSYGWD